MTAILAGSPLYRPEDRHLASVFIPRHPFPLCREAGVFVSTHIHHQYESYHRIAAPSGSRPEYPAFGRYQTGSPPPTEKRQARTGSGSGRSPDRIPQGASPPLRSRSRRQGNAFPCGNPVLHGIVVPASPRLPAEGSGIPAYRLRLRDRRNHPRPQP